jgi:hypothetical protein
MTDIAIRSESPDQPAVDPTGGRLVAWASSLKAAHAIGSALCQTAFVPAHFKGKADDAAAAILFGDEIGLSPTQALRSVYVISGTPALYARTMVALVLHHGHEVWTVDKTDAKVTVAGRRRGSSHVVEEVWTTARAAKAGYTNNKKYTSDPQAMLYARAAADICRQIAPDALAGLAYTVEELEVAEPTPAVTVRRSEPKTTAQRAPVAEPDLTPEPVVEPEPEPVAPARDAPVPSAPAAGLLTQAQSRMLHASLREHDLTDREMALDYCATVIGRTIASTSELTKAEASAVIDSLKPAEDAEDAFPPEPADQS